MKQPKKKNQRITEATNLELRIRGGPLYFPSLT